MSAAGRQLARIESALRRPQPSKAGDRRAIVAAILRRPALRQLELEPQLETIAGAAGVVALDTCDLFFVLRSVDPKGGRWSGQVAFPGGHAEGTESDEEAVRTLPSTFTFHPRLLLLPCRARRRRRRRRKLTFSSYVATAGRVAGGSRVLRGGGSAPDGTGALPLAGTHRRPRRAPPRARRLGAAGPLLRVRAAAAGAPPRRRRRGCSLRLGTAQQPAQR
jgi:hypothetical protein